MGCILNNDDACTNAEPLPEAGPQLFDIVSLKGWDNAGLTVRNSHFFGGIDGVHSKSNGAVFEK